MKKAVRAIAERACGFAAACTWWGLALWTVLAVYFTLCDRFWLAVILAALVVGIYIAARKERFRLYQWPRLTWPAKWRSTLALAVSALVAVYYFGFVKPDANIEWASDQARQPHVEFIADGIDGDNVRVHVDHVRNFTWTTATDYQPAFYNRTYDVSKLDSMYYCVAAMPLWEGVAHVFVSFGFSDGQFVSVSVEGRRPKGMPYRLIPSMFRRFQMIYVIGEERDVLGLRGAIWKKPVYFYPVRTTQARKRAIFLDMMERAHSLEEHPEFYHLITNNCMNNITWHLRRLGGRAVPFDLQVLLTGFSDRVAYYMGFIDTDLPFDKAREAFRVDQWMQTVPLDDQFSQRLRETLRAQEAAAKASEEVDASSP